jgi:tRNA threonylcarbamoyladenosine biosynthesis protein TsaE
MAETQSQSDWQGESSSIEETMAIGQAIGRCARAGDLVALVGELGAGKTQLVRGLARGLGLDEKVVASPTFVMIQEHEPPPEENPLANGGMGHSMGPWLVHVDAYRIKSLQELESVGWDPSTLRAGGELREKAVLAVEWADRLGELLGEDYLRVELRHLGEERRQVTVRVVGNWRNRLNELRMELEAVRGGETDLVAGPDETQPADTSSASRCPICGVKVDATQKTYPFCSDRCKMADLGRWLEGRYVISRPIEQKDLEEE